MGGGELALEDLAGCVRGVEEVGHHVGFAFEPGAVAEGGEVCLELEAAGEIKVLEFDLLPGDVALERVVRKCIGAFRIVDEMLGVYFQRVEFAKLVRKQKVNS